MARLALRGKRRLLWLGLLSGDLEELFFPVSYFF